MKERPINFASSAMRALLTGEKTTARYEIWPQPVLEMENTHYLDSVWQHRGRRMGGVAMHERCPYGVPRDRLWVQEDWAAHAIWDGQDVPDDGKSCLFYRDGEIIGGCTPDQRGPWRHRSTMPKFASRLRLVIKMVGIERLHEITESGAQAEGAYPWLLHNSDHVWSMERPHPIEVNRKHGHKMCLRTPREAYADQWNRVESNRHYPWERNPWVWVLTFERVEVIRG